MRIYDGSSADVIGKRTRAVDRREKAVYDEADLLQSIRVVASQW